MTNIDHAADIIEDLTDEPHLYPDGGLPDAAAQALDDAGLLAPDLPEPVENEDNGNPSWFNGWVQQDWGEVELHHNGRANGEGETTFTPEEARGLAYALLAAADYAERNRHE